MHPADADPQQLHARARAGRGKGPDAIDLYLKVMTHNLWHARMPWLITNIVSVLHKLDARAIPTPCRTSRNT